MYAAQEVFKMANKNTRPEKALILGFMAGSRGMDTHTHTHTHTPTHTNTHTHSEIQKQCGSHPRNTLDIS